MAETRGAAMRRLFPMLFIQAASPVEWARSLEVHSYLEHAANLTDLEQRIRAVEHRRHFNGS